jgi:hypothetical protein
MKNWSAVYEKRLSFSCIQNLHVPSGEHHLGTKYKHIYSKWILRHQHIFYDYIFCRFMLSAFVGKVALFKKLYFAIYRQ